jgi:hypothetical protein
MSPPNAASSCAPLPPNRHIRAQRGSAIQVAGSIPVSFSAWGIQPPGGLGFFGSLADHGIAEFLLVLHRV